MAMKKGQQMPRAFCLHEEGETDVTKRIRLPLAGYAKLPLQTLEKAVEPLKFRVTNVLQSVYVAKQNTTNGTQGLTHDESASIQLYTLESNDGLSFYQYLNRLPRAEDRFVLRPLFPYLKLFLTALFKLPSMKGTVWRGIRANVSAEYSEGECFTWWAVTSCTRTIAVLESPMYVGTTGDRTIFSIETTNGRVVSEHSFFKEEEEIILLPGTCFKTLSKFSPGSGLTIIHVQEVIPPYPMLEPPFPQENSSHSFPFVSPPSSLLTDSFSTINKSSFSPTSEPKNAGKITAKIASDKAEREKQDKFICWICEQDLSGCRYILKVKHPYCIRCYETMYANTCKACKTKIGTDSKDLSYKDFHWHKRCFNCSQCKTSLFDKYFGSKNDQIYCTECYNQQFASWCSACNQIFKPETKKLEHKGKAFHEHCFICFSCSQPIGTKSFIPKDGKSYCVPCYENQFATKCTRCRKAITEGGVTYKNQPRHRECFTCTSCKTSLAGQRFTSRDDQPYCADCFARLYAKKCYACWKPITGTDGIRYISFKENHWHIECFFCIRCGCSLVGRGFLEEIYGPVCQKCCKRDY